MNSELRLITIYDMIRKRKAIQVSILASLFNVSAMTVRRDLNILERAGLIRHSYGKAYIIDDSKSELPFSIRQAQNAELKRKIAVTASQCLKNSKNIKTIYIDGSSTALELVKLLPPNNLLTVYTNNLNALFHLQKMKWFNTFVLGGLLSKDGNTLDDETSLEIAKHLNIDAAFISCSGFTNDGIYNNTITGSELRKIVLNNSGRSYLLADHTKMNCRGIFLLDNWDKVNTLITDRKPDNDISTYLAYKNVNILF